MSVLVRRSYLNAVFENPPTPITIVSPSTATAPSDRTKGTVSTRSNRFQKPSIPGKGARELWCTSTRDSGHPYVAGDALPSTSRVVINGSCRHAALSITSAKHATRATIRTGPT